MLETRSAYRKFKWHSILGLVGHDADIVKEEGTYWVYAPNKGAPIVFAILFAASGIIHGYQCS
jgi:hypothetical protein